METKGLKDYEIISLLGKGAFGEVFKAIRKSDGKLIALKAIDTFNISEDDLLTIKIEINTLENLSEPVCNPFVVCYYNSYEDKFNNKYLIEMEYIEGEEMLEFMNKKSFTDEEYYYYLLLIARDIAKGLQYVHAKNVIHNDIKLQNIIIQKNTFIPKLIDFGLSCTAYVGQKYTKSPYCIRQAGTPLYYAPEYANKIGLKLPASDMWALGVLLYKAATGDWIFKVKSVDAMYYKLKGADIPKLKTSNVLLNKIVNDLLVRDPTSRLKPGEVVDMIDKNIVRPKSIKERLESGVSINERTMTKDIEAIQIKEKAESSSQNGTISDSSFI